MSDAQEIFKEDNTALAHKLKNLVHKTVDRANEMVSNCDRVDELYTAIRIAEVAGKMTGIVQEKQTINMQINQISGFTFIEVDKEAIIQERLSQRELIDV